MTARVVSILGCVFASLPFSAKSESSMDRVIQESLYEQSKNWASVDPKVAIGDYSFNWLSIDDLIGFSDYVSPMMQGWSFISWFPSELLEMDKSVRVKAFSLFACEMGEIDSELIGNLVGQASAQTDSDITTGTLWRFTATRRAFADEGLDFKMSLHDFNYNLVSAYWEEGDKESAVFSDRIKQINNDLFAMFLKGKVDSPMVVLHDAFECGAGGEIINFVSAPGWSSLWVTPAGFYQLCEASAERSGDEVSSILPGGPNMCGWTPMGDPATDGSYLEIVNFTGTIVWTATSPSGEVVTRMVDVPSSATENGEVVVPVHY